MLYPAPLSKDHKILEQEFCSGYIDSFGKWNTGFYCPQMESTRAVYCCGTPTFKYCCTMRTDDDDEDDFDPNAPFFLRTPVMVGIIAGVTLVLLFITIASCFFCSCCFVYKKRRAHLTGGLYRMQCSSTASGLMYSPSSNHDSLVTTPLDADWTPQGQFASQNGHYFLNGNPLNLPGIRNNNSLIQQQAVRLARNISNLPPPVFYPQNHLASTTNTTAESSGTPSSRPSSSLSSFTTRSVSSSVQNGDAPRFTLPPPAYIRNQYSTLARHYPNRPPRYPSYLDARSNNIFATFGPNNGNGSGQQQLGSFGFCTLPRSRPSAAATPALPATGGGSAGMNQITEGPEPGEEIEGNGTTEQTRGRGAETESILNRSNIHRLASCLSSSDSMHQALNASVL